MNTPFPVPIQYIDGTRYERAVLGGIRGILSHEEELNCINVFPIPDKDTGSNLKKTLCRIVLLGRTSLEQSSRAIAEKASESAMGYSGIIFSQFLSGFAEGVKDRKRITLDEFARACSLAVQRAYKAVEKPVEGTVLSVLREWAEEVRRLSLMTGDFAFLLKESVGKAESALQKTPQQLEVLKKNRVVDSGGKAFLYFLQGIVDTIAEGKLERIKAREEKPLSLGREYQVKGEVPFCVECSVRRENLDYRSLARRLQSEGEDFIFYGSLNFAKIHMGTADPEKAFSLVSRFGRISSKRMLGYEGSVSPESSGSLQPLAFVSDTTCDIPDEVIEENSLFFVPIKVQVGGQVYTDRLDIIPEAFYKMMHPSEASPRTSQPALQDFTKVYEHLLRHYQTLISVHLSGELSGTFHTALQAARRIDPQRIHVVDGKTTSIGLGLVLMEGIEAWKKGLGSEGVLETIKKAIPKGEVFLSVPTLKHLVRGGRITRAKGLLGRILCINPILTISREGKIQAIEKVRGRKKLESKVIELALGKIRGRQEVANGQDRVQESHLERKRFLVAVAHTNALELGIRVAGKIEKISGIKVAMIKNVSPGLGAHVGSGAVAAAVLDRS